MKVTLYTAVLCVALLAGVKSQWPDRVEESDIPPGRVLKIPGTDLKGICTHGDPNGPSLWYLAQPIVRDDE